jgi:hydroxymethylpyrimidine pyrophosphatase-like HAD family hydrolase
MKALLLLLDIDGTLWDGSPEFEQKHNDAALEKLWGYVNTRLPSEQIKVWVAYNTGRSLWQIQSWSTKCELRMPDFTITGQGMKINAKESSLNEVVEKEWNDFLRTHMKPPPKECTDQLLEYDESRLQGKIIPGQELDVIESWARENQYTLRRQEWVHTCLESGTEKRETYVQLIPNVLYDEQSKMASKAVAAAFLYNFWRRSCLTQKDDPRVIWAGDGDNDVGMVGLWAGIVPPVHHPLLTDTILLRNCADRIILVPPSPDAANPSCAKVLEGLIEWIDVRDDQLRTYSQDCDTKLSREVQIWWGSHDQKQEQEQKQEREIRQVQRQTDIMKRIEPDDQGSLAGNFSQR